MADPREWNHKTAAEFIAWHESVIAQYPSDIQDEFRRVRQLWLGGVVKRVRR